MYHLLCGHHLKISKGTSYIFMSFTIMLLSPDDPVAKATSTEHYLSCSEVIRITMITR